MQTISPIWKFRPLARHVQLGSASAACESAIVPAIARAIIAGLRNVTPCLSSLHTRGGGQGRSGELQVHRLVSAAALVRLDLEADLHSLVQLRDPRPLDRGNMDEHVLAAAIRGYES